MRTSGGLISFLVSLLMAVSAGAVTLDLETHDALIGKLEEVHANLKREDVSFVPTTLRMADLLADRARLLDLEANEGKAGAAEQALADRRRAIALIVSVESRIPREQIAKVDLQKAQLLQLLGQDEASMAVLRKVRKMAPKTEEYWIASDILADILFAKGQFAASQKLYRELERAGKNLQFTRYRLAWCDLNQGRDARAVKRMEALLQKNNLDEGLRKEAVRDIVIFYARRPFSSTTIEKIKRYSAGNDGEIQENLRAYGEELKRLGKKKESATVFLTYLNTASSDNQTLMAQAELFENLVDVGRRSDALSVLEKLVAARCKDLCADIQVRIHRSLRGWAAEEKRKPSPLLMKAFLVYSRHKPLDENALLLGIKTAQEGNRHQDALAMIGVLIHETKNEKTFETALRARIVSAEKSKDQNLREQAYRAYIDRGQDAEIRSQAALELIGILAQKKKYDEARSLAKDMSRGNIRSLFFKEYKRLTLAVIKDRLDRGQADKKDLNLLLDLAGKAENVDERFRILNDAFLVALKEKDFSSLKNVSEDLVRTAKRLKSKERQLAYEKRILVADMELDFATSLKYERLLKVRDSRAQKFKIVLKARLAGRPDRALEKKILNQKGFSKDQKLWVLEQQVITGSKPFDILRKHKSLLRSSRDLHSRLVLMAWGREPNSRALSYIRSNAKALRGTLADMLGQRHQVIAEMKGHFHRLQGRKISTASLRAFDRSLGRFVDGIAKFDRWMGSPDNVVSMIARSNWIVLSRKLAGELNEAKSRLKVPAKARESLIRGLEQQIAILGGKIARNEQILNRQWESEQFEKNLDIALKVAHPLQKRAMLEEIARWQGSSQSPLKDSWARVLRTVRDGSNDSELAGLYGNLRKNPFQRDLAKKLARAEEERGNHLVSTFLSERARLGGI